MIPPIGIACILIGLFMRSHCITAAELQALNAAGLTAPAGLQVIASSAQVFPTFILDYMPRFFGGVILGTLLITVVGGGAGLSLGAATILTNDIFATLLPRLRDQRTRLAVTRVTILCVLLAGAAVACLVPGAIINDFGFLSMGLRGAVVFIPMSAALFWKGCVKRGNAISAMIAGPIAVLAGNLANLPFDALFLGLAVSLVCCLLGKKKPRSMYPSLLQSVNRQRAKRTPRVTCRMPVLAGPESSCAGLIYR
jgi:SSS family solute:Na+ symporter